MPGKGARARSRAKGKQGVGGSRGANQKITRDDMRDDEADIVDKMDGMTLAKINEILPTELLFKIFSFLTLGTLSKVVQICRRWRDVGEDPRLWVGVELKVNNSIRSQKLRELWDLNLSLMGILPEVLSARRLQSVQSLSLAFTDSHGYVMGGYTCSDDKFQAILDHPGLKTLTIFMSDKVDWTTGWKINDVNPDILAAALKKMEKLSLVKPTRMDDEHLRAFFNAINIATNLKYLEICEDLSSIDATVLGAAISKLEEVDMSSAQLTLAQTVEILKFAVNTESKLKSLHLKHVEEVDSDLLEEANKKLNVYFADSDEDESDDSENDGFDGMFYDDDSDDDFDFDRYGCNIAIGGGGGFYSHGDAMGFPRNSSEWHHFEDKYYYGSD